MRSERKEEGEREKEKEHFIFFFLPLFFSLTPQRERERKGTLHLMMIMFDIIHGFLKVLTLAHCHIYIIMLSI
jgi:hypothetical protein